jgi:hypothetical protein
MTESPRLPAGLVRQAADAGAEVAEVAEVELNRMAELALLRRARTVTIGHGRSAAAAGAAAAFARRFQDQGRIVLDVVTWPEEAASWLRQAIRFGTERAIGLVGAGNLSGLTGATARGGTWAVRDGQLIRPRRGRPGRGCAAGLI